MRSEYVFAAVKEIENRFMLCRVASISHAACIWIQLGPLTPINKSLNLIAAGDTATTKTASDAHAALAEPVATP